jgi:hypothetical protein
MLTTVLVVLLGAGEGVSVAPEVQGDAAGPVVSVEDREAVRLRGAIHFAVAGGFSGFAPGVGPGFSAELGATWADRFSLSVRGTVGTIVSLSIVMAGVAFDAALGERFSVGVAPSFALLGGVILVATLPVSFTTYLPLRVSFAPFGRGGQDVARKGLVVFAEAGPGWGLVMSPGQSAPVPPPFPLSVTAAIGVGYAVW